MAEIAACFVDCLSLPGYVAMTALCVVTSFSPILQELASHGKTRQKARPRRTATTTTKSTESMLGYCNEEWLLVKKTRFRLFYVLGTSWLTLTVWLASMMRIKWFKMSTMLLYLHLLRRCYECTYIHQWRDSSRMHLAGFIVGALHYLWLPSIFIQLPCFDVLKGLCGSHFLTHYQPFPSTSAASDERYSLRDWLIIPIMSAFCLWAQYQQYRHHVLLAELRNHDDKSYSLPSSGWFHYVVCPHYLAEVLIYLSFYLILAVETHAFSARHFVMLLWVVTNLTVSARMSLKWYKANLALFLTEGKQPIFPKVL